MINFIYYDSGPNKGKINWIKTNPTIDEIKQHIKEKGYKTKKQFNSNDRFLYTYCKINGFLKIIEFQEEKNSWKEYDTVEKSQEYIDSHGYTSRTDLLNKDKLFYKHLQRKNFLHLLKFKDGLKRWDKLFDTIEKVQEYIDQNEFLGKGDLQKRENGLYSYCYRKNWLDLLKFPELVNTKSYYYIYDTIDKVQDLIDTENISSSGIFNLLHPGIYKYCCTRGWTGNLVFTTNNKSAMEDLFDSLFPPSKYLNIKRNTGYLKWLRSSCGGLMKPDVLIDDAKLVIEFQGSQHFSMVCFSSWDYSEEDFKAAIERDNLKYKLLTEHGYTVVYFVDTRLYPVIKKLHPEKFEPGGYIGGTTIMTSWDELVDLINEKLKEIEENATNL